MSADNTIVVMGFGDGTYKVGHFQNAEELYWNEYSKSFTEELNLNSVQLFFDGLDLFFSYEDVMKEAVRLHDDIGYVEYGIRFIRTDKSWNEIGVYQDENE